MSVEMYTIPFCPFCVRAKALLRDKGVAFREIDVAGDPVAREEMHARAPGWRTVPQIFIGQHHVGGCEELMALEREGRLDLLLKEEKL